MPPLPRGAWPSPPPRRARRRDARRGPARPPWTRRNPPRAIRAPPPTAGLCRWTARRMVLSDSWRRKKQIGRRAPGFAQQRRRGEPEPHRKSKKCQGRQDHAGRFAETIADVTGGGAGPSIHDGEHQPRESEESEQQAAEKRDRSEGGAGFERRAHDAQLAEE